MVRLLNEKTVPFIISSVEFLFSIQQHFTHIKSVNEPNLSSCIYAMWHAHQCCLFGVNDKSRVNILISRSKDGDVIARVIEDLYGFKSIRGSKGKQGAVEATMQMIEVLKNGEKGAIMVDGPRGPLHKVKSGIIKIAKHSGVPIVPVTWYSSNPNWLKLPSWDRYEMPIGDVRLINLYGEPIYVPKDGDDESDKKVKLELEQSLLNLDKMAPEEFDKVYWHGLWQRRK